MTVAPTTGKKILSVSRDRTMLRARNDALAIAGFSVSSPKEPEGAIHILLSSDIDVIVLGHSIPKAERMALTTPARKAAGRNPLRGRPRSAALQMREAVTISVYPHARE